MAAKVESVEARVFYISPGELFFVFVHIQTQEDMKHVLVVKVLRGVGFCYHPDELSLRLWI